MSIAEENNIIDHELMSSLPQEDHDILDEFLDQRVYDSVSTANQDLVDLFYLNQHGHGINSLQPRFQDVDISPTFQGPSTMQTPTNESYMYMDGGNFKNSEYTTPLEYRTSFRSPNTNFNSPSSNEKRDSQLSDYEEIRDELSKLKFGNQNMNPCPPSVDVPDPSYLDFSQEAMSKMPFNLHLSSLPSYSRVETQVKLKFSLSPPPPQLLLHIPQDLVSKNKFCLNENVEDLSPKVKQNLLYLDTYVLTSNFEKSCNICPRCIKREQKRASRRKVGNSGNESENNGNENYSPMSGSAKNNANSWADEKMMKKAIIFNCKEIVSFPSPNGLNSDLSKSLELSARIICYCRHHNESEGFKLLFVITNSEGKVVAKQISSTIMIMDRKKNTASVPSNNVNNNLGQVLKKDNTTRKTLDASASSITNENEIMSQLQPLSPNSIDESMSENQVNTDTDGRGFKRKKLSVDDSLNSSTNPMFNGSVNGFSPLSNSDTNTSAATNILSKPLNNHLGISPLASQIQGQHQQSPTIQRIIPAQGPLRGGIEVTLLGFNFQPGLQVKFGANLALSTHCWSDSTIVTYLPPASQPGQVLVSLENHEAILTNVQQQQIFTYTDDTDKQLIELALQIVGLKMNGKLEEAKNIARRIVGTDASGQSGSSPNSSVSNAPTDSPTKQAEIEGNIEWFNSAHKAVEQLTSATLATEEILINFLSLVDLPNCPIIIPNWQLCNEQGQTLFHLATLKNYKHLIGFLITHGSKIDVKDNQGITPLFLASMCGHRELIRTFIECRSNWNLKLSNDKHLKDYCDLNVLDMFNNLEEMSVESDPSSNKSNDEVDDQLNKSRSLDSLNSLFTLSYGRRISKMVFQDKIEIVNDTNAECVDSSYYSDNNSEFADSEYDSNDEDDASLGPDQDETESTSKFEIEPDRREVLDKSLISESPAPDDTHDLDPNSSSLWSKVKRAFNNDDDDSQLPSYDDLFPFGPSAFHSKPKTHIERTLNDHSKQSGNVLRASSSTATELQEDAGIASDSSDDVVMYINRPRKNVEHDKMLLFFWFPALVCVASLFIYITIMGYKVQFVEDFKNFLRSTLGNLMVGNDRLARVFKKKPNVDKVIRATQKMIS